jgi:Zinc finger, C3HC4 type (RING finger)
MEVNPDGAGSGMGAGVGDGLEPVPDIAQDNAGPTAAAAGVIEPSGDGSSYDEGDAEDQGSDEESGGESNGDDSAARSQKAKSSATNQRQGPKVSAPALSRDENEVNGVVTVPDPAAATSTILADIAQLCYCSVCLGLMVKARAIVPCGHVMCFACSRRVNHCPECRGRFHSTIPCRISDSATRLLVSTEAIEFVPLSDIEEFRAKEKEDSWLHVHVGDLVRALGRLSLST